MFGSSKWRIVRHIALCAALAAPASASADVVLSVPAAPNNGLTIVNVGMVYGDFWINVLDKFGRCDWYKLSNGFFGDNLIIEGSGGRDYVRVWQSSGNVSLCGTVYPFEPASSNGTIVVRGNGGDDILYGSDLDGGAGNDWLHVEEPTDYIGPLADAGIASGGSGHDRVFPKYFTLMFGDGGNDRLCAPPNVEIWGDGGAGSDIYCGDGFIDSATRDCNACGF